MNEKGHISIHAENILPIIKRWLYSEKEIFIRELVSNAADALTKLQKLSLIGEVADIPEARIAIAVDKSAKTLTISDTGIGMSADEIKKYINQVAFSGLHDFMEKYKDKDDSQQVIGHFGLGFYSSFMVADRVEIETLSCRKGVEAARWSCDGSTEFKIESSTRKEVGTSIVLHIGDDSQEMLEESTIRSLLNKYCAFIRYPIYIGDEVVNDPTPLWTRSPTELKDEDYRAFFSKVFPMSSEPLFWIHLNVDYPFNLKGVLYFPKLRHELDASQGEVKLYCNQVFVADNSKELIPEFLTLLKGVVDCPDIPLNVSRSYLQSDPTARKISEHITKKVADKLSGMAKTDRENYEKFWDDIHPFVKFGMMRDSKFCQRMKDHLIFKSSTGSYTTIADYQERMKDKAGDDVLYCSNPSAQASYVSMLTEQGVESVEASTMVDSHFLPFLEMQASQNGGKLRFKRVDADLSDHLVAANKSTIIDPKDQKTSSEKIEKAFQETLKNDQLKVRVEHLKSESVPAVLMVDENMRRLKEMAKFTGGVEALSGAINTEQTLVVNQNSPAIQNLLQLMSSFNRRDEARLLIEQVFDLALLQQGEFTAERMQSFIDRSGAILGKLGGSAGAQSPDPSTMDIAKESDQGDAARP